MIRFGRASLRVRATLATTPACLRCFSAVASAEEFRQTTLKRFVPQEGAGYIGGDWVSSNSGGVLDVTDPATGDVIGNVADMTAADADRAIEVASETFKTWKSTLAKDRARMLRRWYDLMTEHTDDLAEIITRESGKALPEARAEVAYGAAFIDWYAEEGRRAYGDVVPTNAPDRRIICIKQPVGVSALITPWNFPNAMIARKAGPALAAGCTVVIKPAEDTPLSALAMAKLAAEAGIPDGVINVVTSSRDNTRSTAVGKLLYEQCASSTKRVGLELGGNAPFIVFDDADIDRAVAGAVAAKFRNTGQTCVCANRLFVQSGIYEEFVKRFTDAVSALQSGHGLDEGVEIGPVINVAAADKYEAFIADASAKGANALVGTSRSGLFCAPTVLRDVSSDMDVFRQEIFGPIAPVFKFDTEDEVINMANDTDVGLAGYFYTSDMGRAFRVAEALETGMVGVNEGLLSTEVAPFGGVKESGIGKEGGHWGLDEYMDVKYMCLGGL